MRWLLVVGLVVGLAGLGAWRLEEASGQATLTKVVAPASWPVNGGDFTVQIQIENVANLGAYEWGMNFDPAVVRFVDVVDGGFLDDEGRTIFFCGKDPNVDPALGNLKFGCGTTGSKPGVSGSGLLSTITFAPVASGASALSLGFVSLSDPSGDVDLPSTRLGACVVVGSGASCATPTVAPPATATAGATALPGSSETPVVGPTSTPIPTGPTPTPVGPTPTPAPTPPPEQSDWVELAATCNPVTITYPEGSTVQTLANAISPPEILGAMWSFKGGVWLGYSPQYPQASNLALTGFLDVVFFCVDAPGVFVRPIV